MPRMLLRMVDRTELAGAVTLVTSASEVLESTAVGMADIAAERPMTLDTLFWIASQTKPITATLMLRLDDEGLLDLDAEVTDYLPHFRPRVLRLDADGRPELGEPRTPVMVHQLLSHTSGLPFSSSLEAGGFDRAPIAEQVEGYALTPLQCEPGTSFRYSNAGYNVAARIAEVVTGARYEDLLDDRLFRPLGMSDTTFWPDAGQIARLARQYQALRSGLEERALDQTHEPLDDRTGRHPFAGGGLFSTAVDMGAFARLLLSGGLAPDGRRLLSEAAISRMTSPAPATVEAPNAQAEPAHGPRGIGYGLGWSLTDDGAYGHGGAARTNLRIHPREGIATVWMVQHVDVGPASEDPDEAFREFDTAALRRL
jgi:CubicO group peptidase (beta-lactamase class C family)